MSLADLQSALGHAFGNPAHLERALTTNSYVNEWDHAHPGGEPMESQEAFATLGDAVLKLILVHEFIETGKATSKGTITTAKQELESRYYLAQVARRFGLGHHLRTGRGEREDQRIHENDKILAETMEAVIAAIYMDAGFDRTRRVVMQWDCYRELTSQRCFQP